MPNKREREIPPTFFASEVRDVPGPYGLLRPWELPSSYPLVAPDYAKTRSSLAKKFGLGRKGPAAPKRAPRNEPERAKA